MKTTSKLFLIGVKQVSKDGMIFILVPAPFLVGVVFKFVIPYMNTVLQDKLSLSIQPWYGFFDSLLICLASMLTAMITAFLLLEERDERIIEFYQITPTGGYTYLLARIGIPMGYAYVVTVFSASIFCISGISAVTVLMSSLVSTLAGIFLAMMMVSLAENRVEGLALSKIMGISLAGLPLVWFVSEPYLYLFAFLPSFWIGRLVKEGADPVVFLCGLLISLFFIVCFTGKFNRRLE